MLLNSHKRAVGKVRILILSCPKTGNVWLRSLLAYAFRIKVVDIPLSWTDEFAASLPEEFVAHQHLHPTGEMLKWLIEKNVQVFTTVRHPGDTFISLFHFVKWNKGNADVTTDRLGEEETPGAEAVKYIEHTFPKSYSLSTVWPALGAVPVRYEDLLADPLQKLRQLCARIGPVSETALVAAVLMCQPRLFNKGAVDPRHVRAATSYQWVDALPAPVLQRLQGIEPYRAVCTAYGYDWVDRRGELQLFDYDAIDPFRGLDYFDNGEKIGYVLKSFYFIDVERAQGRWPDPACVEGDSYWKWLSSPCLDSINNLKYPAQTYSNLMKVIWDRRDDLQSVFPDPVDADRAAFADWFVDRILLETDIPWALVAPVQAALAQHYVGSLSKQ